METLGAALMTVPIYADAFADGDAGGVITKGNDYAATQMLKPS